MRTIGVLVLFAAAVCGGTPEGKAALEKGDYKLALQELQAAAEGGDAEAQFLTGEIFRRGLGLKASPRMAAKWYELAAGQGHTSAAGEFGIHLWQTKKRKGAIEFIQKGADAGYGRAAYVRALLHYRSDRGVPKLEKGKMYALLRIAATQGHADAQYKCGFALEFGLDVKKSADAAEKWYRKAAAQGHPKAFFGVAGCIMGRVKTPDGGTLVDVFREGLDWYRKGALQGHHAAQYMLALSCLATQRYMDAYVWETIGAELRYSRPETDRFEQKWRKDRARAFKKSLKTTKQYTKPEEVREGDALIKKYIKQIRANMKKGLPFEEIAR